MSLILDALKRAERERKAQAAPMLADLVHAPGGAPVAARRYWRYAGIAAVALIAGLLLWTVLREPPRPTPQAEVAIEVPPAPPPAPVVPGTESVASLDDLTDETAILPEAQWDSSALTPAPAAPTPSPTPAAPAAADSQAPAPPASSPDAAQEAIPAQSPVDPGIPPVLTQAVPLRKLREMPPDYRADFPALSVEVHVYEREVAKRMLMVNGRRYREGERLAEGPLVIEIVPEGIVFEHRGEKVLYTLGR